jgi:FkbM family methyltransferase
MQASSNFAVPLQPGSDLYVPHVGWLRYPADDIVLLHLREGSFESSEQAFLWSFLREGDTFLDIGAHCGLFSALASQIIGKTGKILACEPNPEILPYLMANTQRDRVDVHAIALSDSNGEATLSQGDPSQTSLSSIAYELANAKHTTVRMQTLDDFLKTTRVEHAALAKVDVEGSELKLFQGGKQTLQEKTILAFMVEFTEENMRKSGYSARELTQHLTEYGYRPYKLAASVAEIVPFEINRLIEYENILFTHDLPLAIDRVQMAAAENARRSKDIADRGSAAEALVRSLWNIEREATKRLALIDELTAECKSKDKHIHELTAECRSIEKEATKRLALINELTAECASRLTIINESAADRESKDKQIQELTAERRARD